MDSIRRVWDGFDEDTRQWLIAHNGEQVPGSIPVPAEWIADEGALKDELVDWVEAVANGETPS